MKPLRLTRQKIDPAVALAAAKTESQNILRFIDPIAIYLFGSATTDHFSNQSDLDILIVCRNAEHLRDCQKCMRTYKTEVTFPIEFVWTITDEFERKKNLGGVCMEAFQNGKLLYKSEDKT